jgi:hypothetical protein
MLACYSRNAFIDMPHLHTDLYKDLMSLKDETFNTSEYPPEHFLLHLRTTCEGLRGWVKWRWMCGWISRRVCWFTFENIQLLLHKDDIDEQAKMSAEEIKRCYVANGVQYNKPIYVETLRTRKSSYASFGNFGSRCHRLETVNFEWCSVWLRLIINNLWNLMEPSRTDIIVLRRSKHRPWFFLRCESEMFVIKNVALYIFRHL